MSEPQKGLPRISVIVRAHNDESLIGRTLAGIFSQQPPPFEVIVCDDNSTDRTREVAARFPVRFVERPLAYFILLLEFLLQDILMLFIEFL